jgi:hypothetical protein
VRQNLGSRPVSRSFGALITGEADGRTAVIFEAWIVRPKVCGEFVSRREDVDKKQSGLRTSEYTYCRSYRIRRISSRWAIPFHTKDIFFLGDLRKEK